MIIHEKHFTCKLCRVSFVKKARKCYYCDDCARKQRSLAVMISRKKKHPEIMLGVGSGGNQQGEKNHCYIDGLSNYKSNYRKWHPEIQCCEICGSQTYLVVHHIDQNRKNNHDDNLILVCRSCHASVHRLARSLGIIPVVDRQDDGDDMSDTHETHMTEEVTL